MTQRLNFGVGVNFIIGLNFSPRPILLGDNCVWLDLTFAWVISYVLVSLIFDQHANDGHTDKYGAAHMCYLWCLMVYLLFCNATSPFSSMAKWCNGEIITDGTVMVVRLFFRSD